MKNLLFSVTAKDFRWDFFRAGGHGGQNVNKRDTAVRCTHPPSGAVAVAREERTQPLNRKAAFRRCVQSVVFQNWLRIEAARYMGKAVDIEEKVRVALDPKFIRTETKKRGKWYANSSEVETSPPSGEAGEDG